MLVAGALASVRHLKAISAERDGAAGSRRRCSRPSSRDAGLPVMPSVTHIVPLLVGCPVRAKQISDILLAEYGLYVQPINFPTVPRGTERLRFTPGPHAHRGDDGRADRRAGRDLGPAGAAEGGLDREHRDRSAPRDSFSGDRSSNSWSTRLTAASFATSLSTTST